MFGLPIITSGLSFPYDIICNGSHLNKDQDPGVLVSKQRGKKNKQKQENISALDTFSNDKLENRHDLQPDIFGYIYKLQTPWYYFSFVKLSMYVLLKTDMFIKVIYQ